MSEQLSLDEKYDKMLTECESMESQISAHFAVTDETVKQMDELKRHLEGRALNKPVTVAEALVITSIVRQAVLGHRVSTSGMGLLNARLALLVLAAKEKVQLTLEVPKNVEKQLILWTQRVEAAEKAQRQYTQ